MTKEFRPDPSEKRYTFDDVQGIEEAKDEVKELVEFLRNPEKFQRLGAKLPTGRWRNDFCDVCVCERARMVRREGKYALMKT